MTIVKFIFWYLAAPSLLFVFAVSQAMENPQKREESHVLGRIDVIPQTALHVLSRDEVVVRCLKLKQLSDEQLKADWFVAIGIHLQDEVQTDLLVRPHMLPGYPEVDKSESGCWDGVKGAPLWVLKKTDRGFQVVLSISADNIEVLSSRTHGIHDVTLTWESADSINTVTFQFDGKKYVAKK